MEKTKIEWTEATFNPWMGCTKVSPACDHCYAEQWSLRFGSVVWGGERKRTSPMNWRQPIIWNRKAAAAGVRLKVFCASLADVFDNQVPHEWRLDLYQLIRDTPWLDWQLLTKRPRNFANYLPEDWGKGYPNVWLGTTAENQIEANRRVPILLSVNAVKRFVSYEPALGPVDFTRIDLGIRETPGHGPRRIEWNALTGWEHQFPPQTDPGCDPLKSKSHGSGPHRRIDWVLAGEESGPGARAADYAWFRSVRDQCRDAGTAFFMKQLTTFGKKLPTKAWPPDLKIREWPDGPPSVFD